MTELVNSQLEIADTSGPNGRPALAALEERAGHVARRLAEVANAKRLLILCHLAGLEADPASLHGDGAGPGEASVSQLQRVVGLSQSALSQHLARLRKAGLVDTRRQSQTVYYRLADQEIRVLMRALYETFCGH